MDDSLEYSTEALSVKGLFYNKKITVYVEGPDDKLFWDYLFNLAEVSFYIEDVGGIGEIDKYVDKIVDEDADFFVACDRHYTDFLEDVTVHERIIRTYGHSIENSMYSTIELEKIISKLSKQRLQIIHELNEWVIDFSDSVYELLVYDIANERYKRGISVFGDKSQRFLVNKHSHKICGIKTDDFLKNVRENFSLEEIEEVKHLLSVSEKDFWFMIKGHFITNAVINLIKNFVKKYTGSSPGIALDMIYTLTVDCTQQWESKIDIKAVVEVIKGIDPDR